MDFHIDFDELNKISNEYGDINDSCDCDAYHDSIAIIGVHASVGSAKSPDEIWEALKNGRDMISDLPERRRRDVQDYAKTVLGHKIHSFPQKAYMEQVDTFDAGFFHISPAEAELMDPVQRIFLESAWTAIEDAGYSAAALYGSRTGVYVGYNNSGRRYEDLMEYADENLFGLAVSGNVDSMIAGRISYLMNLKGPALMIDTACSSSLVALHLACSALKNNEIAMALVGGIRIFLCPEYNAEGNMGTMSPSERTKTFDEEADGTGSGEGVISFVLKPLETAKEDNDHIYGIIRASSINQDGASLGITAPNLAAQKEVIVDAWKKANIDPNEISYIEAHGTATKLGDPIEIGALDKAFGEFTKRKQFCAVGAVKSNFGHLDCAAGLLGVLKVLLMMKNGQIPSTLHFHTPNRKIEYVDSAVYINDILRDWPKGDSPRMAGVNSFGISGTNCHVVLQEAPDVHTRQDMIPETPSLFVLSAKDRGTLERYIDKCRLFFKHNPDADFTNFCYTMLTGRDHYSYRFAAVLKSYEDFLKTETPRLCDSGKADELKRQRLNKEVEQLFRKKNDISEELFLEKAAEYYRGGADLPFEKLFKNKKVKRISAPTYPFSRSRFWAEAGNRDADKKIRMKNGGTLHPLIDICALDSDSLKVYKRIVSLDSCHELSEHKIGRDHVMPGTVYVEMAYAAGADIFKTNDFVIKEVTFLSMLTCMEKEEIELHLIAEEKDMLLTIRIAGRSFGSTEWVPHAKIILSPRAKKKHSLLNIEKLKGQFARETDFESEDLAGDDRVRLGPRWKNTKKAWYDERAVLAYLKLSDEFNEERSRYYLYPALMDCAVNAGNLILNEFYLPFSYKDAVFYQNLPQEFYTYVRKKDSPPSEEIVFFEVTVADTDGNVLGVIDEYTLKKVNKMEDFVKKNRNDFFHEIEWEVCPIQNAKTEHPQKNIVVFTRNTDRERKFLSDLKKYREEDLIVCRLSSGSCDEDIRKIDFGSADICIDITALAPNKESAPVLADKIQTSFKLLKSVCAFGGENKIKMFLVTENARLVNKSEEKVDPENNAIIGMYTCVDLEYANIDVCCIDIDKETPFSVIFNEFWGEIKKTVVAYRGSSRYVEVLKNIPYSSVDSGRGIFDDVTNVIIAGGTGGIGIAVSERFADLCPDIRLFLLGRRDIHELDAPVKDRIKRMQEKGFHVQVVPVDIKDAAATENCVESIRREYGKIDAVVMAAGAPGGGIFIKKTWEDFYKTSEAKCQGAWNLHNATMQDGLKHFIMFSSFTSVLGSPGQSDYTAANAYIDAFHEYRVLNRLPSQTINWTGWSESGMAFANHVDEEDSLLNFVDDCEGADAFMDVVRMDKRRVLVGEFNYRIMNYDLDMIRKRISLAPEIERKAITVSQDGREAADLIISGKSADKLTNVEKNVASAWSKTLKTAEVNIYDKFFESGGNSLLATFLKKELDKVYPGMVAITDIFIYSTISEIAAMISNKIGAADDESKTKPSKEDVDIEKIVQQYVDGTINMDDVENLI